MALTRRGRAEVDWPFGGRRPFDWPDLWRDLTAEDDAMRVEEFREGDTMVVRAEMPGIDPEKDVEITVADGVLRVKAERREEKKTEGTRSYRSEFRYGSFVRSMPLPSGAAADDVKATYADGILEVRIPIDEKAAGATRIPITKT